MARWDEPDEPRTERRRHRRRRERRPEPSPEERALREARRAANRKMGFLGHLVPYLTVCLFLLFVAGFRAAFVVALSWGIGVACHGFFAVVAPELRRRLLESEVERRVQRTVSSQRREWRDEQTRSLEALSASIAHEIRNPITAAKSLVQQMGEDPRSGENVEYAKVAIDELDRVERSISHLLRYARDEEMRTEEVRIRDVIESAVEAVRDRLARADVAVRVDVDSDGELRGDPGKLRRVLINLLGNAAEALESRPGGDRRIEVAAGENLAGSEVWVRVRDNGPGIPAERLPRIWSPFHTSKAEGTGLGLAISKKLVEAHGGAIEVDSEPGRGTEFRLTLPKRGAEAPDRGAPR